jgi:hypothetical protein
VSARDNPNTIEVTSSDKLDHKQNNKLTISDKDLSEVVRAWNRLPREIRSAILMIVRAAINNNER